MKNILFFLFLLPVTSIFSQNHIDTTVIENIRYEWQIDLEENDSTLTEILTEYESGIFKEEYPDMRSNSKFGYYHIYDSDNLNRNQKSSFSFYAMAIGNVYWENYFDRHGILDSISKKLQKEDTLKILNYKIEKEFRNAKKGKLNYLINEDGEKEVYKYNILGKLKRINQYKDSELFSIREFKNGLLVAEKFPQRKHRKQYTYEYNSKGQLTKKAESDHFHYKYSYNDFGIKRVDKIYEKRNMTVQSEIFEYFQNGRLKKRQLFNGNNRLIIEYHYWYE